MRTMAVLFMVLLAVAGCSQASQAPEQGEKEDVERATGSEPTEQSSAATEGMPQASALTGQNLSGSSFDLRVLDHFETERYYYPTDPSLDMTQEYFSEAGKFVVVNYTVTNTSSGTISPTPIASLQVRGNNGVELYELQESIAPANRPAGAFYQFDDIPPRQLAISQFIFDVPTDVEPELLIVRDEPTIDSSFEVGNVDMTASAPRDPRPEERYALLQEYISMRDWERSYDLYAQETKDRVPFGVYQSRQSALKDPSAVTDYSFPSVEVQGDEATIERVLTVNQPDGEFQDRGTTRAVLETDGWKLVMSDEAYEFYEGPA